MAIVLNGTTGISTPTIAATSASTFTGALALPAGGLNVGSGQLAVDASGRVTMPYQPAFHAGSNIGSYAGTTSSSPFAFNVTKHNIGSHYNTSSYRFTAPIAGLYFFYFSFFFEGGIGNDPSDTAIYVNGSILSSGTGSVDLLALRFQLQRTNVGYSVAILLTANDYVDVRGRNSVGTGNAIYGPHSCFGGYLIG
jgi:hypothetical protein